SVTVPATATLGSVSSGTDVSPEHPPSVRAESRIAVARRRPFQQTNRMGIRPEHRARLGWKPRRAENQPSEIASQGSRSERNEAEGPHQVKPRRSLSFCGEAMRSSEAISVLLRPSVIVAIFAGWSVAKPAA